MTITTTLDVFDLFSRSPRAASELQKWQETKRSRETWALPFLLTHATEFSYLLSMSDIQKVCETTEHALGNARRWVVDAVPQIRDWNPWFSFSQTFHIIMEEARVLPTYQEFRTLAQSDQFRPMLWGPAAEMIALVQHPAATQAMRWRIGNAYYSFLRELHVLVYLREHGIQAQMHPVADSLFRTDLWIDDLLISLYVGNSKFRSGDKGRKMTPEKLLADAQPPFRFLSVDLPTQRVFGQVHLVPQTHLRLMLQRIEECAIDHNQDTPLAA